MPVHAQDFSSYLAFFTPFLNQEAVVFDDCFTKKTQLVLYFVYEMQETITQLTQPKDTEHAEVYAARLLRQFDALKRAVAHIKPEKQALFQSSYQFPKNIHSLPAPKRLNEYRKALRALHEKTSWLIEQNLKATDARVKQQFENSIQETEYRKQKCIAAIEKLEEELSFVK